MYQPKHFVVQEYVPQSVYSVRGGKSLALMDDRIVFTTDQLRNMFGPMVINNWSFFKPGKWYGDLRNWSGLRTAKSPYGTMYSQHRFGRAIDAVFRDVSAEEVRRFILANPDQFPYIASMETGVSWLHVDCRNCDRILTYRG